MDQNIIDRAVNIATRQALAGYPVSRIIWIPPNTSAEDFCGNFVIEECPPLSAAEISPWDR